MLEGFDGYWYKIENIIRCGYLLDNKVLKTCCTQDLAAIVAWIEQQQARHRLWGELDKKTNK